MDTHQHSIGCKAMLMDGHASIHYDSKFETPPFSGHLQVILSILSWQSPHSAYHLLAFFPEIACLILKSCSRPAVFHLDVNVSHKILHCICAVSVFSN